MTMAIARSKISAQWRDSDGYWVELKAGYCDDSNPKCHTIVEDTKTQAMQHRAVKCDCSECKQ